jgi:hypothetical protein
MQIVLAVFLFAHGFVHLVGFVVPWRIANLKEMPYKTTVHFYRAEGSAVSQSHDQEMQRVRNRDALHFSFRNVIRRFDAATLGLGATSQ